MEGDLMLDFVVVKGTQFGAYWARALLYSEHQCNLTFHLVTLFPP